MEEIIRQIDKLSKRLNVLYQMVDRQTQEVRDCAVKYSWYEIVEFLPGKIEEINKIRHDIERTNEMIQMLDMIVRKEESNGK